MEVSETNIDQFVQDGVERIVESEQFTVILRT